MCIINNINGRKLRMASLLALVCAGTLSAGAVTGVVIDEYGRPVPSAQVTVKGTDTSVLTGQDGVFDLDLKSEKTVCIVAPGYMATEFNIGALKRGKDKENVRIVLSELNVPLSKTIPSLTGSVNADSYIGSASTVYTDRLNRTIGSTIIPGIVDKIAGLNITQYRGARQRRTDADGEQVIGWYAPTMGSGIFSDNSEYNISSRGMAPIVYIDGIERDFYSIDPDAIESVSLQKDALSTMFNGMRSSRPVLYITTRLPQSQGTRVSFTGRFGISNPLKMPKALSSSQYAYLLNEALQNDGRSPKYDKDDYYAYLTGANPMLYPDVDWFDNVLRDNSTSQYYNVNVTGGNNFAQYFVSAGYYYENGMFKDLNEGYDTSLKSKRYSVDSKVNMHITDDFTASISLLARLEEGNQPGGSGSGYSDLLLDIYRTPNNAYPIKNPNGTWGGNVSFDNNLMAKASESGYISEASRDLLGMVNLKYDFNKYVQGLSAYAIGSITVQNRSATFRTMRQPVYEYVEGSDGVAYNRFGEISTQINKYQSVGNFQQMWGKLGVDYERQWGSHSFKAGLAGDTRQNINNYDLPSLPSNIMQTLAYDYDKKYFAQMAVTESYYNRYAPGKRWGAFYAAGLGWDIARENFMAPASDWLGQLKLRLIYGRTGNGIDNSGYYTYYQTYSSSGSQGYNWGSNPSNLIKYTYPNTPLANPYITWEKADKWDAGVDASFFGDRLLLQADYYNDKYFDLLQTRGKSIALLGTVYPLENIGRTRRQGGEVTLTWQDHIGAFNYYVSGNWNIESSKVLFKDEQAQPYDYLYSTGHSAGAMFGLVADGFFTSMEEIEKSPVLSGYDNIQPGDIKYRDLNNDGVIDDFDRTIIGGDKPLHYFGLDFGFDWKGFEFAMDWQGVYNRDIYINDRNLIEGFQTYGQSYGQAYELLLGRWTPETASTAILPRLSVGGNDYNMGGGHSSSFWVKNGNFLRCKNLYIAYTLPQTFCRNYLAGVRPKFFANVQNLCTISGCSWVDPEVSFTSYPLQRTWSMGVNLKF